MKAFLDTPFTALEVKKAIHHMGPLKSLGPDGMFALFYQKYWHIIGNDTTNTVLNFLNNGDFIYEIN